MVSAKEIAEKTGKSVARVKWLIRHRKIEAVFTNPKGRHEKYYDDSAAAEIQKPLGRKTKYAGLSDEKKRLMYKARQKEYMRTYSREHRDRLREQSRLYMARKRPAVMWKVSVMNISRQWIVRAVCLKMREAKMISDELNAVGIKARFKPHSYGVKKNGKAAT